MNLALSSSDSKASSSEKKRSLTSGLYLGTQLAAYHLKVVQDLRQARV